MTLFEQMVEATIKQLREDVWHMQTNDDGGYFRHKKTGEIYSSPWRGNKTTHVSSREDSWKKMGPNGDDEGSVKLQPHEVPFDDLEPMTTPKGWMMNPHVPQGMHGDQRKQYYKDHPMVQTATSQKKINNRLSGDWSK